MTERPSKKGAIAKQLEFDGLSVISKISAARIIAQAITKDLQILIYLHKNTGLHMVAGHDAFSDIIFLP